MVAADVIVIGACAAGLAAARALADAGRQVIVLEARDRIGGRAYRAGCRAAQRAGLRTGLRATTRYISSAVTSK